jgi:hypothetical protein
LASLAEIIEQAVADYGFRIAVIWGTDDLIARSELDDHDGRVLTRIVVPELRRLPNLVEPGDRKNVSDQIFRLASVASPDRH